MTRIGIIAAMPGELKPLVQGWKQLPAGPGEAAWSGFINGVPCIAVCAGMGRDAALRACSLAAKDGPLSALISTGWAGALSCGMMPGDAYVINEVVDAATGEAFATDSVFDAMGGAPLKLVTIDHVAVGPEKKKLGMGHHAVLADMEAATVARFARDHGCGFYCLKAVSDTMTEIMPDFSRYTDNRGHLRLPALLAHVAVRPQYWPGLARMGRNGSRGAVALAQALGPMAKQL
jgi:adenosylhomocysteine nucleosidase